jgi:hypothetical protein
MQEGHVKDKATLSKTNSWHEIITSMKGTTLWKIFEGKNQESFGILSDLIKEECEEHSSRLNLNEPNSNSKKYPHFSPQALLL